MAITYVGAGPGRAGVATVVCEMPAATTSGDLVLWGVVTKYPPAEAAAPSGFTEVYQGQGGAGAEASDSGLLLGTVFSAIATGTEGGATQSVAVTGGNVAIAKTFQFARSGGVGWSIAAAWGAQNTASASWSVAADVALSLAPGDIVVVINCANRDQYTTQSAQAISATGITFGAFSSLASVFSTTQGNDATIHAGMFEVTAGTATVAPTFTMTHGGAALSPAPAGGVLFVRLRETSAADTTPPVITGPGPSTGSLAAVSVSENTTAVHTFTANETVTWSLNGGADESAFTINSSTGALSFLTAQDYENPDDADGNNSYIVVVRATDAASNTTDQTVTVNVTNVDETAPTLTSPTASATAQTTATGSVTTNESGGTLYAYASINATETAATIVASGDGQAVSSSGAQSVNFTGLTADTTYYAHYVHDDAVGNRSAAVHSASFATPGTTLTITTDPLRNAAGTLLASTAIAAVFAIRVSDLTLVETWEDVTTDGSGVLSLESENLTEAAHLIVTSSAGGTAAGAKAYTPA